ncbi:MAG TPA: folate-binding protein [Ideonella sp.]|nr:folate-binding protein [Ideonella sp.]
MPDTFSIEGIVPLTHLGVIRARGEEAASFLQGQLTNDVAGLDFDEARLAGYCSAKGRLLATFVVWRSAPDELLLACSADLLAATLKRLSMFVLRARCKLADASGELQLFGLAGAATHAALGADALLAPWRVALRPDGARLLRLPDAAGTRRSVWIGAAPPGLPNPSPLPLETWRWLEVQSGVPLIEAVNVEQFVPQMVNLELVGGVNFGKGCYPGQEVVARSQYRGTLKRRMALFDVPAEAHAGDEVFHDADPGQPAGRVVEAAPRPQGGGSSALVEVKLAALAQGTLHLHAADGPALAARALPYPLPAG